MVAAVTAAVTADVTADVLAVMEKKKAAAQILILAVNN